VNTTDAGPLTESPQPDGEQPTRFRYQLWSQASHDLGTRPGAGNRWPSMCTRGATARPDRSSTVPDTAPESGAAAAPCSDAGESR